MSVFLSKEELELKGEIKQFAEEYVAPKVGEIEKSKSYDTIRNIIHELGKRGFLRVLHPKEYGGSEFGVIGDTIIAEELSAVNFALDLSRLASIHLCGMPLHRFGTHEQKEKFLVPLIKGEKIGAIGITEPDVGSDAAGMKTRAHREGDYYIINGEKRFITNGSQADYICLFAITTPLPITRPKTGMTAFIVEKGMKGFTVEKDYELMGLNGTRISHLRFENVTVPAENRIAEENYGFKVLMDELNSERVAIAGQGVGVAKAAFETALRYSTERVQFDREIR
ncbi:MAG: acyl-CoA dehydrogenase family protein, partial [Candidatus Helarchaeota archaeon]|nr:acyl-CoA dehydrogenase family protein [Candidatus Helarchaeota archaeon]